MLSLAPIAVWFYYSLPRWPCSVQTRPTGLTKSHSSLPLRPRCCWLAPRYELAERFKGMVGAITVSIMPMMILLSVGALIGSWIISGTVPGMIYYGVQLLDPGFFYAASAIICALASLSSGQLVDRRRHTRHWSDGDRHHVLAIPAITPAPSSRAPISVTSSPLSDTTNLAAAAVGVDLFEHIKNMLDDPPAFIAALVVFSLIGSEGAATPENIAAIRAALSKQFAISPWVLSPWA